MKDINFEKLPEIIDISCVKQNHTFKDIDRMVETARKYQFICTFALPSFTPYLISKLKNDTNIMVGGTVGFPSGCDTTECKIFQAKELLKMGCDELDMVINISRLKSKDDSYVYHDIRSVVETAGSKTVKAILEVTLLNEEEIVNACRIAEEAGVNYIKTGTGWCNTPTTVEHIRLIKEIVKDRVKIKAAGGIRDLSALTEMWNAGCNRFGIGTGSAIQIIEEAKKRHSN